MSHLAKQTKSYSVGIITVSDSRTAGGKEDVSGPQIRNLILDSTIFPAVELKEVYHNKVPDDKEKIKEVLIQGADAMNVDLIVTVGGTGFSPRDVTPEATEEVCTKKAESLAYAMTSLCYRDSPFSLLSRATCGIRNRTLIVNLPGSAKGSKECFLKISKILPHAIDQIRSDMKAVELRHMSIEGTTSSSKEESKVPILKAAFRPRTSGYPMVSCSEALGTVLSQSQVLDVQHKTSPGDYFGHVCAQDVKASIPSPPFRASIKDGYAVLVSDGMKPRKLLNVLVAGDHPEIAILKPGGCVRVNTGSPIPANADAVVQVEDTIVSEKTDEGEETEIQILKQPKLGLDIREIGSDIQQGQVVIPEGTVITAPHCGILAGAGVDAVAVYAFPRVGILITGDELIPPRGQLRTGAIIDCSSPVLTMMLVEMGVKHPEVCYAKDDPTEIKLHLKSLLIKNDVVIITGGVSMGEKDYVKEVLITDYEADLHFGRIHMKPGKPTTFATVACDGKKKLVFCLPGNPVSTVVTFQLFVVPSLRKMMGHKHVKQLVIQATLTEDVELDPRPEYHRAHVTWDKDGRPVACSTGNQLSSRLLSFSDANGLLILPSRTETVTKLSKDCAVQVMLMNYFAPQE